MNQRPDRRVQTMSPELEVGTCPIRKAGEPRTVPSRRKRCKSPQRSRSMQRFGFPSQAISSSPISSFPRGQAAWSSSRTAAVAVATVHATCWLRKSCSADSSALCCSTCSRKPRSSATCIPASTASTSRCWPNAWSLPRAGFGPNRSCAR